MVLLSMRLQIIYIVYRGEKMEKWRKPFVVMSRNSHKYTDFSYSNFAYFIFLSISSIFSILDSRFSIFSIFSISYFLDLFSIF